MVTPSSSVHAIRNQPAARLPRRQLRNATTRVNTAATEKQILPIALTKEAKPHSLARLAAVSATKSTANQPKYWYARGEKSFRSAISRVNKHATAPLKPTGTFQANEVNGRAYQSHGQSKACPDRNPMYTACRKKSVAYRMKSVSAMTNQISNDAAATDSRAPTARVIIRARSAPRASVSPRVAAETVATRAPAPPAPLASIRA